MKKHVHADQIAYDAGAIDKQPGFPHKLLGLCVINHQNLFANVCQHERHVFISDRANDDVAVGGIDAQPSIGDRVVCEGPTVPKAVLHYVPDPPDVFAVLKHDVPSGEAEVFLIDQKAPIRVLFLRLNGDQPVLACVGFIIW